MFILNIIEQITVYCLKILFDGFNDIKKIKKEEERVTLYKKED